MSEGLCELNGLEKASVLLMSLEPETSTAVLRRLEPEERELVGAQIVKMRHVRSVARRQVLEEACSHITAGSAPQSVSRTVTGPPLGWLEDLSSEEIADILEAERIQNVALVIAHLSPQTAAQVLSHMDESRRNQVAGRLAKMGTVSGEAVATVDDLIKSRVGNPKPAERGGSDRHKPLLHLLAGAAAGARDRMTEALSAGRGERGIAPEAIESIDDIRLLNEEQIAAALRDVEMDDLCLALRVAKDDTKTLVMSSVPGHASQILRQELTSTAPARVSEIERSQMKVIRSIQAHLAGTTGEEARNTEDAGRG